MAMLMGTRIFPAPGAGTTSMGVVFSALIWASVIVTVAVRIGDGPPDSTRAKSCLSHLSVRYGGLRGLSGIRSSPFGNGSRVVCVLDHAPLIHRHVDFVVVERERCCGSRHRLHSEQRRCLGTALNTQHIALRHVERRHQEPLPHRTLLL